MHIILSHSHTDFDGLAAQYAAGRLYPDAYVVLAPQLYASVAEFVGLYRDVLGFVDVDMLPDTPVTAITLVDTDRVWGLWQKTPDCSIVVIDHHVPTDGNTPTQRIEVQTGATTTAVVQRMLEAGLPISAAEATLFALGVYEDTGNLTYDQTSAADVRLIATLLDYGANVQHLRYYRRQALTQDQHAVYQALLPTLGVFSIKGWNVVLGWVDLRVHVPDLSGLVERVRDLYLPAVLVVAFGLGDGSQLIARSNAQALDVGALMRVWDGGGHAAAAAAWVAHAQPEQLMHDVQDHITQLLTQSVQASDMMTTALVTLSTEQSVQQALQLLRRWDYGALPIVDSEGVLVGDIGRAELRKAEQHRLLDVPVRRYMWRKPATISPDVSLSEVRRKVAHDPRGRVYVVDDQHHVQGMITRGDVLHFSEVRSTTLDKKWFKQFQQLVHPDLLEYIMWAARWVAQYQWGLFVVGGFVRDLMLQRAPGDLDLVVEGDAVAVAQALAQATQGTVRSHQAFGTATVEWLSLPGQHLDFITARTEFYEYPTALPFVEAASLRHDLHRRDFSINTLALALSPPHQGQIYDFYGGVHDLQNQSIRVLHNLSFVDDPTRVLRALRFAGRLDFEIEVRTAELMHDALKQGLLQRVSPARVRHELERVLAEPAAPHILALLDSWQVLVAIHPQLLWSEQFSRYLIELQLLDFTPEERVVAGCVVVVLPLAPADRIAWLKTYMFSQVYRTTVEAWNMLESIQHVLQPSLAPSELDRLLAPLSGLSIRVAQVLLPQTATTLQHYLDHIRPTKSLLSGTHLHHELQLNPGPGFRPLLAEARAAQLDGAFSDLAGALAWMRVYVQFHKEFL